jgi:two-component system chemotaxis sensor kinase CheA
MTGDPTHFQRLLFDIFVKEAQTHLAAMPPLLGKLQQDAADKVALHDLLREIHSLKGAASAVEQDDVAFVCRLLEQRAYRARQGEKAIDTDFFGLLHQGLDLLHAGLPEVARGGKLTIPLQFLESVRNLT